VDDPAITFSPGNWTGDSGRGGAIYRQTWYPGAYFRLEWTTTGKPNRVRIKLDPSVYGGVVKQTPRITYVVDGRSRVDVPCDGDIDVTEVSPYREHKLAVYFQTSLQSERWGTTNSGGHNVVRVTGVELDADAATVPQIQPLKWILEVGDSITEGSGTTGNLDAYSYFVGQAFRSLGYEYCVSACGWSGWLQYGDRPKDVPPYYFVSGSSNGEHGLYDAVQSRWDKIDGNDHSLLDITGHISGYGGKGQEPSLILINYGTNDAFYQSNLSDLQASITQALEALRIAAPNAKLVLMIPFEQFSAPTIKKAFAAYQTRHSTDHATYLIDLGPEAESALRGEGYYGGVHPNMRGHAVFAARILAAMAAKGILRPGD
jgi:hypothetical protein